MNLLRALTPLLISALPLGAVQTDVGPGEAGVLSGRLEKQLAEIMALDAEIQSLSQRLGREGTPLPRRAPERLLPPPEPVPVQPVVPTPPVEPSVVPTATTPTIRPAIPVPENLPPAIPVTPPPVAVAPPPVASPPTVPIAVAPPAPAPTVTPSPVVPAPERPAPPTAPVIQPPPEPVAPLAGGGPKTFPSGPSSNGGDYTVVAGDTLSAIARKHNLSLAALQKANPDIEPAKLQLGQKLVIPGRGKLPPSVESSSAPSVPGVAEPLFYTVKPGDTLDGIARRAGTPLDSLSQENGITNPESLKIGQKLKLPAGSKVPAASTSGESSASPSRPPPPGTHVVKPGDTLSSISRETGTPLEELRKVNNLKDDTIHPGQSLKVRRGSPATPSSRGNSGASVMPDRSSHQTVMAANNPLANNPPANAPLANAPLANDGSLPPAQATEMTEYTVKNGDSIFSIARRYFMSQVELAAMNQLPVDAPLQVGQKLCLPSTLVAGALMAESESLDR